jgi:hypothetical protein
MATRRRAWLVLGLAVVLVAAFTAYLLYQVSLRRRAAAIDSAIQNGPLRLSLRIDGGNVTGSGWQLRLDPPGNATLKINSYPTPKTRQLVVSKAQLDELRKALLREHFFDLADSYGEGVVDGGYTTFQVYAGDLTKTVNLYDLRDRTRDERERLSEPSRALRVLQVVLAWFNDPELNEMRKWDQKLIDAAGRK